MKKGFMSGVFSLLLVMACIPGTAIGDEVEKPEVVTEGTSAEVETVEQTEDLPTQSDSAVSSEITTSELFAFPGQLSIEVDEDRRTISTGVVYDGSWYFGSCSQTCYPCRTSADCSGTQKCLQWCP